MENSYVGPFLIIKKLGNRRHKVYYAKQTEQDRDVALKFIQIPPSVPWDNAVDKINREVNELQKLKHPNLVTIFGAGVDQERIFFATELVHGESLSSILARRGRLAPDLVVEYGRQIAEFLQFLHSQNLIHSKLTPEKIMVTDSNRIKISDLRLNRAKRRRWDSTRRRELDLAAYMAPEQFQEGATEKSDYYSLGVILYEMLTGKLPYPPDTMGRLAKMKQDAPAPSVAKNVMNCPIWLDKMVTQMLDPDPSNRPHSARAIVLGFEEIQKISASKKAAVAQISGGFNALTAGEDKTEAKQLLGIAPESDETEKPFFFQTAAFQGLALVAILGASVFLAGRAMIPPASSGLIEQANLLMVTDDPENWSKARDLLKKVIDRKDQYSQNAETMYYDARRKSLVLNAENGTTNPLYSENVQLFVKAVRLEKAGEIGRAVDTLTELVAVIDPNGNERHVFFEAKSRLEALESRETLPTQIDKLSDLIAKATTANSLGELQSAQRLLSKITLQFAGVEGYEEIVAISSRELRSTKQKISDLEALAEIPNQQVSEKSDPEPDHDSLN
ncbi:MAG: serine/threonine-protein kinase [Planctomycetota bacterium]